MPSPKLLAIVLIVPFAAVTGYALLEVGYAGIVQHLIESPAGWQIFADLVCALLLVCAWMIADARRNGRNVWPYLIATLALGSFGPLAYLILAPGGASGPR